MIKTVTENIAEYRSKHRLMSPDNASIAIAKELWVAWEQSGQTPPNVSEIAVDYAKWENGFFYDMVKLAERLEGKELPIHYCAFCLDEYNFYAVSATDGYIVLVDDYFFQLLFVLSTILMSYAQGLVNEDEEERIQQLTRAIIKNNYFDRRRFEFGDDSIFIELLGRDYEIAEFSNYFFAGLKAFVLSHEFGHHILGHTAGTTQKTFGMLPDDQAITVDTREQQHEFEADVYGYKLFELVSDTVDESIYYAYCKYKFRFAPLFLFDLFEALDKAWAKYYGVCAVNKTHPHPRRRYENLVAKFDIDINDPLYIQLKCALDLVFEPLV